MRLGGTFFGATRPIHWLASKPGTTVLIVGTSGSKAERAVLVTASGRRPPDLICSMVNKTVPTTPWT